MSEWLRRFHSGRHHVRRTDTLLDNHPASNRCNVEAADKLLDVSKNDVISLLDSLPFLRSQPLCSTTL
jgi:hypothetical protein